MTHPTSEHRTNQLNYGFPLATVLSAATSLGCGGNAELQTATLTATEPQTAVEAAALTTAASSGSTSDPALVKVATGLIRGNVESEYRQFLGIPYAAAPTGALRWKSPMPASSWRGVRDASVPEHVCPQHLQRVPGATMLGADEDCLFLNVTTPNKPSLKQLPVMVWIHGGGYTGGSAMAEDASGLVQKADVIVVTINYRLGALGFLAHPALSAESRDNSGNFGLLDQQAALTWTKANIAQFGGDPNHITIFGASAGGNSVWAHVISPKSAGLFQRAISISGLWSTCWNWQGYGGPAQPFPVADAEGSGKRFAEILGCTGSGRTAAKCLRDTTVAKLVEVGDGEFEGKVFNWGPTTGGAVLPQQLKEALTAGAFNRVPIINGSTHDEAMPFVLMPFSDNPLTPEIYEQTLLTRFGEDASIVQAQYSVDTYGTAPYAYSAVDTDLQNSCYTRTINGLASKYTKIYAYEFDDPDAVSSDGSMPHAPRAYHGSDVPFIFPSSIHAGFTPEQAQLSDRMIEYYTSFAKTGAPAGQTAWLPYDPTVDAVQLLSPRVTAPITSFASDHQCAFWAKLRGI